ncbi:MAG: amidohydrolase [Pseudonocardiales bacterium]|nr:amidohydrolase [Pseudonocardiales bacterium]
MVVPTVVRNARIYSPAGADLSAMVIEAGTIAWLGTDDAVSGLLDSADEVIDLDDALVTPAFVDAHVHCTALGLSLAGLNLAGSVSRTDVLDRVAAFSRDNPGRVVLAEGWDESGWPDPIPPTALELDRAAGGAPIYLARVDGHSAVVSSSVLAKVPEDDHGFSPLGWLRGSAHDRARTAAFARLDRADRSAAQRRALEHAASLGIGCLHEMAGPAISSEDDLSDLLALAASPEGPGVEVIGYWGELHGIETAVRLGAAGAAGDLFCDGSIGSHTAALRAPYTDAPHEHPAAKLNAHQISAHVIACTIAGIQAGFHAIGDAAIDEILAGFDLAAAEIGSQVRTAGHRIEHVEMVADPKRFAAGGLAASMQPAFDATWGGRGGMYERRLGADRAATMNDFSGLISAGTALAFGSDAPVTPLNPWGAVRAAAYHHTPGASISARAAFSAHTRGGWRAARRDSDGSGVLDVGTPATFAVWDSGDLFIDVPDERVSRWSTDPRAAIAGLPDLAPDQPLPRCRRTVVRGRVVWDAGN